MKAEIGMGGVGGVGDSDAQSTRGFAVYRVGGVVNELKGGVGCLWRFEHAQRYRDVARPVVIARAVELTACLQVGDHDEIRLGGMRIGGVAVWSAVIERGEERRSELCVAPA